MRAEILQIFDIKGHSFITSTIRGRGSHKILISCAEGCGRFSGRCVCVGWGNVAEQNWTVVFLGDGEWSRNFRILIVDVINEWLFSFFWRFCKLKRHAVVETKWSAHINKHRLIDWLMFWDNVFLGNIVINTLLKSGWLWNPS